MARKKNEADRAKQSDEGREASTEVDTGDADDDSVEELDFDQRPIMDDESVRED